MSVLGGVCEFKFQFIGAEFAVKFTRADMSPQLS